MTRGILFSIAVLGILLGYGTYKSRQNVKVFSEEKKLNSLKVLTKTAKPFFDEGTGTQTLETFLHATLGQLIYLDENFDLVPGLLKSFHFDYETKSYVLRLRKNIVFHNGRAASAEDLEFSLLRGFFYKGNSWFTPFFGNIEGIDDADKLTGFESGKISGVRILDSLTISVKLKHPNPSFLHSISRSYFSLVPKEELEADGKTWKKYPVGAGTYKIVEYDFDQNQATLEKVSKNAKGPDSIEISSSVSNPDLVIGRPQNSHRLENRSLLRVSHVISILFNFENDLARQKDFRRALELSLDRGRLTSDVDLFKETNQLLAPTVWGGNRNISKQDASRSQKLLASVKGLLGEGPLEIPVYHAYWGHPTLGSYLDEMSRQFSDVGLNIRLFDSDKKHFTKEDKKFPFTITTLGADIVDPIVLYGLFAKGSPLSPHYPKDDTAFADLLGEASGASVSEAKVDAVKKVSKYFFDNAIAIPLFFKNTLIQINPKRIASIGKQDGGVVVFLDRIELK